MAKMSKPQVDAELRALVFGDLIEGEDTEFQYWRVNDRQYGALLTDANGHERYVRIGVIVAEEREDMTAEELMESEVNAYRAKQEAKAEKAKAKEEKIARDKARREAKEKEAQGDGN
jgi:hypothetical protein